MRKSQVLNIEDVTCIQRGLNLCDIKKFSLIVTENCNDPTTVQVKWIGMDLF